MKMNSISVLATKLHLRDYRVCLYFISLVLLGLTVIGVGVAYYVYMLVAGYLVMELSLTKLRSAEKVLLAPLPVFILQFVFMALISIVGIKITALSEYAFLLLLNVWIVYMLIRKSKVVASKYHDWRNIFAGFSRFDWVTLIAFCVAIVAKVVSISGFEIPILHDPIAHALWAKSIAETGQINFFYSPGLHINAAVGILLGGFAAPKQILLLTNIFNAYCGVPVYLWIKRYFKNNWFALLTMLLLCLGEFPMHLYYLAGKNAFIVATPVVFVYLMTLTIKDFKKRLVLTNLLMISLILIHYPTAVIAMIMMAPIELHRFFKTRNLRPILSYIPTVIFGIIWVILKYPYRILEVESEIGAPQSIVVAVQHNLSSAIESVKSFVISTKIFWGVSDRLGYIFLFMAILGAVLFLIKSVKNIKYRFTIISFVILFAVAILIDFLGITALGIITITASVFAFVPIYFFSAFMVSELIIPYIVSNLKNGMRIIWVGVALFIVGTGVLTFIILRSSQTHAFNVTTTDMQVLSWVKGNADSSKIILNGADRDVSRPRVVYEIDSGAWIPFYTNNDMYFSWMYFSTKETQDRYELFAKWITNPNDCTVVNQFLQQGVKYYFDPQDHKYAARLYVDLTKLSTKIYKLDKKVGESEFYEIIGCGIVK